MRPLQKSRPNGFGKPDGRLSPFPGRSQDERQCQEIVRRAVDDLGGIDILVNNAAHQMALHGIETLTTEQLDEPTRTCSTTRRRKRP